MLPVLVELISGGRGHRDTLQSDKCYNRGRETGCRNPEEEKPLLAWGLREGAVDMTDGLTCRYPSLPPQNQGCLLRFSSNNGGHLFPEGGVPQAAPEEDT